MSFPRMHISISEHVRTLIETGTELSHGDGCRTLLWQCRLNAVRVPGMGPVARQERKRALPALDLTRNRNYSPHVVIVGAGASKAALPRGDANGKPVPLMTELIQCLDLAPLRAIPGTQILFLTAPPFRSSKPGKRGLVIVEGMCFELRHLSPEFDCYGKDFFKT